MIQPRKSLVVRAVFKDLKTGKYFKYPDLWIDEIDFASTFTGGDNIDQQITLFDSLIFPIAIFLD